MIGSVTPEAVFESLPVCLPKTHHYEFVHEGKLKKLEGVSKCPLTTWMETNQPYMTAEMWGRLCMKTAENDLDNLSLVAVAAERLVNARASAPMDSSTWDEV